MLAKHGNDIILCCLRSLCVINIGSQMNFHCVLCIKERAAWFTCTTRSLWRGDLKHTMSFIIQSMENHLRLFLSYELRRKEHITTWNTLFSRAENLFASYIIIFAEKGQRLKHLALVLGIVDSNLSLAIFSVDFIIFDSRSWIDTMYHSKII